MYKPAVERSFQEAMKLFNQRRYAEAGESFQQIVRDPGQNHRTSAAYLMAAKSYYHVGDYRQSVALLRTFLGKFEGSEYIDDAFYTLALDQYQLEEYKESAQLFLRVKQSSPDSALALRAGKMLNIVASDDLHIPDLRELLAESTQTETKAILTVRLAEQTLQTGDAKNARDLLRTILTLPKTMPAVAEAETILERINRSGVVRIGVVLPLSIKTDPSAAGGVGKELLDGIRLAVDEYNAASMPKVNLEVRDSERDAGVAARQVSELSSDDQILAILGPVFSNEVFSSAGVANRKKVSLITPTATSNGIASIGEYVFQANPDLIVRGRAMAQYASLALGAKRFAVLGASDTTDRILAAAFAREVEKLGGQLIGVQYYKPGDTDLRDQIDSLRHHGLALGEPIVISFPGKLRPPDLKKIVAWGVPQQVVDSLVASSAVVTVESLFGDNGRWIADSLRVPTQRVRARYDSLGLAVTAIDAIFLPISSSDEIGIVTSQLRYFNFQSQLLGTGYWYDINELEQNRQYSNGVIFSTDSWWDEVSAQYQKFADECHLRLSREPSPNAMIGYDTMNLLLRTIRQGATSRDDIQSALSTSRPYQGVHSKISFDRGRVNSCLTMLQFKNRAIKKVGEIDVSRQMLLDTNTPK